MARLDEVTWAELDPKVLAQWLTTVRTRFDVLLLDLPAVGAGEGAPLAALGEQTLMVVAASHSHRNPGGSCPKPDTALPRLGSGGWYLIGIKI